MGSKKKKVALVSVVVMVVAGVFVWVFMQKASQAKIHLNTTDRAREFINSQKQAGNQDWVGTDIDATGVPSQSILDGAPCFRVELQHELQFSRKDGECNYFAKLKGALELTIYMRDVSFDNLEGDPGVLLRRNSPDVYSEEKVVVHGDEYLLFVKKEDGPEITAITMKGDRLFAFNLIGSASPQDRAKFDSMLKTVFFYNE